MRYFVYFKNSIKAVLMNFKKLIEELKRRNVFKVATAYAIAGWLIIQVVTSISEPLSLPDWFDTGVILLVFIGFPIALIIAWAFELTSEGLKKSKEIEITKSVTASTGKKLNRIIIAVLSLAVIFLVINRVFYAQASSSGDSSGIASIAVLPFVDLSPKGDQEYFSDGLSEELLNVLAKVKEMKVAGRTSSFKFKGKNDDLKVMGAELGVAHILEGSVRKSGDRIRITAQLIKVNDGFHMWSETYDRDYSAENLFDVQDEISQQVLEVLKVKLLGTKDEANNKTKIPTKNTKAYEAYLKGNQLLLNRKPKEIEEAILLFKEAIALDTKFALAYARLAIAYSHLTIYGNIDMKIVPKLIRDNADQALLLDNTLGTAYAALANYYELKLEFKKGKEANKKAYELEPNNSEIVMWYANSLGTEDAKLRTELYERAYEIDPLAPVVITNMANDLLRNKKIDEAEAMAKKNVELNPDYSGVDNMLINMLRNSPNGKLDEAFINTYKAYQKKPNNLQILGLLSATALDINLLSISLEAEEKLTELYPENQATTAVHFENYTFQREFGEIFKEMGAVYDKFGIGDGSEYKLGAELQKFDFNKNYKGAVTYIEKYHPIYTSDTLSVAPYELDVILAYLSVIYSKVGKEDMADRLARLYTKKVKSEFKFDGALDKEDIPTLFSYAYSAALTKNAKLTTDILNELYFKRKSKLRMYVYQDMDMVLRQVQETNEFKELTTRVNADLKQMRTTAVEFLKSQSKWPNEANE